jgi:hypothetical protein
MPSARSKELRLRPARNGGAMLQTFRASTVERLAVQMASPAFTKASLLLLGPGFARDRGVPSTAKIARSTFTTLLVADPRRAQSYLTSDQLQQGKLAVSDDQELVQPFYQLLTEMYPAERASLFRYHYEKCPSPPAYRIAAGFIQHRRFSIVVMTYLDMFFSEMLDRAGLKRGDAYRIIDPVLDKERTIPRELVGLQPAIPIIRLYGDPRVIRVEDILRLVHEWPVEHRCVAVGYDLGNSAVNECLMQQSGDLWWVGPQPADSDAKEQIAQARPCYCIDYENDRGFDRFFAALDTAVNAQQARSDARKELPRGVPDQLFKKDSEKPPITTAPTAFKKDQEQVTLRAESSTSKSAAASSAPESAQPTQLLLQTPFSDNLKTPARKTAGPEEATSRATSSDLPKPVSESRNLKQAGPEKELYSSDQDITMQQQRIRSAQEVLAGMEQQLRLRGYGNPGLETDVEHQRKEIASLERQLLVVAETRIIKLMNAVVGEAAEADCGTSARAFLKTQAKTVEKEFRRPSNCNTDVIAAAIAGATYMARSIRDIDQQTVRELESFLPGGVLGRR